MCEDIVTCKRKEKQGKEGQRITLHWISTRITKEINIISSQTRNASDPFFTR